jgi:hypothetical protein
VKPQAIAALPFLAIWIMKQNPPKWVSADSQSLAWTAACLLAVAGLAASVALHLMDSGLAVVALGLAAAAAVAAAVLWYSRQGQAVAGRAAGRGAGTVPEVPLLWARITAVCLGLLLLAILPFFVLKPWDFADHLRQSSEVYKAASFWAYNFWGVVVGMDALPGGFVDHLQSGGFPFIDDNSQWFGIDYRYWGITLTVVAIFAVCVVLTRAEGNRPDLLALGTALSVLAFYLFMTRMHERYLFPMFLPMLAACALAHSRLLWGLFIVLAIAHFLNLYYVYWYYRFDLIPQGRLPDTPIWPWLYDWIADRQFLLSLLMTLAFPVLLAAAYRLGVRPRPRTDVA